MNGGEKSLGEEWKEGWSKGVREREGRERENVGGREGERRKKGWREREREEMGARS